MRGASAATEIDIEGWLRQVDRPIFPSSSWSALSTRREGNAEGVLYGETVVFTGALSIPRREAADLSAKVGCDVGNSITKKTTMLVVGTQDKSKLNGYEKSSKHRKTETLIEKGVDVQILSERDFSELIGVELLRYEQKAPNS